MYMIDALNGLYGPFDRVDEACEYAYTAGLNDSEFTIRPLHQPYELALDVMWSSSQHEEKNHEL
jgi:hypothetical protein